MVSIYICNNIQYGTEAARNGLISETRFESDPKIFHKVPVELERAGGLKPVYFVLLSVRLPCNTLLFACNATRPLCVASLQYGSHGELILRILGNTMQPLRLQRAHTE